MQIFSQTTKDSHTLRESPYKIFKILQLCNMSYISKNIYNRQTNSFKSFQTINTKKKDCLKLDI